MKLEWKLEWVQNGKGFRLRTDLAAGWYLTSAKVNYNTSDLQEFDRVEIALYDEAGELGAEGIAYGEFDSLYCADSLLWSLLSAGEGPKTLARFISNSQAPDVNEVLTLARSLIRDASHGWPSDDLAATSEEVCDKITQIVGDDYNFEKGE
jgi:hypothetical protein